MLYTPVASSISQVQNDSQSRTSEAFALKYVTDPSVRSTLETATELLKQGKIKEAFSLGHRALEISRQSPNASQTTQILIALGRGYIFTGEVKLANKFLDEGLKLAIEVGNQELEAQALTLISAPIVSGVTYQQAESMLMRAIATARKSSSFRVLASALNQLASTQLNLGKIEEASRNVEEALRIAELNQYDEQVPYVRVTRALVHEAGNRMEEAHGDLELANTLAQKLDIPLTVVYVQANLAKHYGLKEMWDKAIRLLESTLALARTLQAPFLQVSSLEGLALMYEAKEEYPKAIKQWNSLLELSQEADMPIFAAEAHVRLALLYERNEEIEAAISQLEEARLLHEFHGNDSLQAQALFTLVRMHERRKDYEAVLSAYDEAWALLARLNDVSRKFIVQGLRGDVLLRMGKSEEAATALESALKLYPLIESPTDEEKDLLRSIHAELAGAYWDGNRNAEAVISLARAIAIARQRSQDEFISQHVEILDGIYDWDVLLDEAGNAYTSQDYNRAALLYTVLAVYYDLKSQAQQLATSMTRLGEILNLWKSSEDRIGKLTSFSAFLAGTDTAVEGQIVSDLMGAQLDSGESELANEAALWLAEILEARASTLDPGRYFAFVCLASHGLTDAVLAITFARECKRMTIGSTDPKASRIASTVLLFALTRTGQPSEAESLLSEIAWNEADNSGLLSARISLALAYQTVGIVEKARMHFEEALRLAQKMGDKERIAYVRRVFGALLLYLPNSREEALSHLRVAEKLYVKAGDTDNQLRVLFTRIDAFLAWNEVQDALKVAQQAHRIARSSGQSGKLFGESKEQMGRVYSVLKQTNESIRYYKEAISSYSENDLASEVSNVLQSLTDEYAALGDFDTALDHAHQALVQAESSGINIQVYLALSKLAYLHDDWGNFALAISYRKRALQVARRFGNPRNKYWAEVSLSRLLTRMGDSEGAAAHAEEALKTLEELTNNKEQKLIDVYLQLANIHGDRTSSYRDPGRAHELLQNAMAEAEAIGLESVKVEVMENLADYYVVEGQHNQAIELFESVASYKERTNEMYGLAFILLQLSEAYAKTGRLKDAQSAIDRARPLVEKQNDVYLTGNLYYFRASLLKAQGRLQEALIDYKRTTDLIEEARGSLSGQARVGISGAYEFVYDEFIDALYRLYETAPDTDRGSIATRALRVSEENKARQFSESLGAIYLREGAPGAAPELIRKERSLLARRNTLLKYLSGSREAESIPFDRSSFFADIQTIEQEMDELIRTLRNDFPSYAALKYPAAVDLADLQLRDGELVLVYNTGREATFLWVLRGGPNGALVDSFHKLQVNSAKLEQLVQKFRRPFSGQIPHLSQFDYETSEELFDVLLSAVGEEKLKEYKRIFVVPDGDLYLIPFEALSPRAREVEYVLDSIPISYFPSATAMALARIQRPRSPPSALLFAVGDPVSDPSDERILFAESPVVEQLQPEEEADAGQEQVEEVLADLRSSGFSFYRLPATGREVRAISQALGGLGGDVEVRLGFEATKKGLLATDLSRFRFLHFATHGILPKEVSFIHEPALVLSMEGTDPRNMFLTMSDVLNLRLNAEVVTLSACETGLGKNVRSEGIIGLPRAFMFAGASSVVVSLWKVADDSTAEFMKEFYSNIAAGKDKAVSLALARHRLRESGKDNPFFWAPFIMWGE